MSSEGWGLLEPVLQSRFARNAESAGQLIATNVLPDGDAACFLEAISPVSRQQVFRVVEHRRVWFPSYPAEWPAEMLHAAANLTLDLALSSLDEGFGLKDATPWNILFDGPKPVFIDVLSFESRRPTDPEWLPYAQFIRTFLLPLLANKFYGISLSQVFLSKRDGLEPEEFYRLLRGFAKLRPLFLQYVTIPVLLGSTRTAQSQSLYQSKDQADKERARYTLKVLLNGLRRASRSAAPITQPRSVWSGYMEAQNNNYTESQFHTKRAFVEAQIREFRPAKVLDVGCNTGEFSSLAARLGSSVVAIDYDPVVVGTVWRNAVAEGLDILPLVVDLTRPTPSTGWRNQEWPSFLDRARGSFDMVLMLAVLHHMLVTERIPLEEVLRVVYRLTRDLVILEFVGPEDSMFQRLVRGRMHLYEHITVEFFEKVAGQFFHVRAVQAVPGAHRRIYLLQRRDDIAA